MEVETTIGTSPIIQKVEAHVRELLGRTLSEKHTYHSIDHTLRVATVLRQLAIDAEIGEEELEDLIISALFHDTGFGVSKDDHETHSINIAREFLEKEEFPSHRIQRILRCIAATRMHEVPKTKLAMLIKDADTSGLGMKEFFRYTEDLRNELNAFNPDYIDESAWDQLNVHFLKGHQFFTDEAKRRYDNQKDKNLKQIKSKLGIKKKKVTAPKEKKAKLVTIGASKSAQTQFKTALRNHIDLSAIADNKANTMLSVTALIISLALPIIGTSLATQPHLLIPTILLLIVCVVTIVFATLATRPIKMGGNSTLEQISAKKSNLFFFGNFFKMSFNDYEVGMRTVLSDDAILDNAITRDLFFLGKALGKKYIYLRWCYNVFMFGIIIAVGAFAIAFWVGGSTPN